MKSDRQDPLLIGAIETTSGGHFFEAFYRTWHEQRKNTHPEVSFRRSPRCRASQHRRGTYAQSRTHPLQVFGKAAARKTKAIKRYGLFENASPEPQSMGRWIVSSQRDPISPQRCVLTLRRIF
jgi:hypothetical protein